MYICGIRCREFGRPTELPATDTRTTYTHTYNMLPNHRNI